MSTQEALRDELEALRSLNRCRFDFVLARAQSDTTTEALTKIGKSSAWYYSFPQDERTQLEALAEKLHQERALKAYYILEEATEDAANVKVAGLKSRDERTKQQAASEILDRVLGKAFQPVTGKDGGPIQHEDTGLTDDERADRITALLERARTRRDRQADSGG